MVSLRSGFNSWFACRIAHWGRKCHRISGAAASTLELPSTASHNSRSVWLVPAWWPVSQKCNMSAGPRQAKAPPRFEARSLCCPICQVYCEEIQGAARRWKPAGIEGTLQSWQRKPFLLHHSSLRGSKKVPLEEALTHPASPVLLDQPESHTALGSKVFSPTNNFIHQQFSLRRV